jgi:hypothetical protein
MGGDSEPKPCPAFDKSNVILYGIQDEHIKAKLMARSMQMHADGQCIIESGEGTKGTYYFHTQQPDSKRVLTIKLKAHQL